MVACRRDKSLFSREASPSRHSDARSHTRTSTRASHQTRPSSKRLFARSEFTKRDRSTPFLASHARVYGTRGGATFRGEGKFSRIVKRDVIDDVLRRGSIRDLRERRAREADFVLATTTRHRDGASRERRRDVDRGGVRRRARGKSGGGRVSRRSRWEVASAVGLGAELFRQRVSRRRARRRRVRPRRPVRDGDDGERLPRVRHRRRHVGFGIHPSGPIGEVQRDADAEGDEERRAAARSSGSHRADAEPAHGGDGVQEVVRRDDQRDRVIARRSRGMGWGGVGCDGPIDGLDVLKGGGGNGEKETPGPPARRFFRVRIGTRCLYMYERNDRVAQHNSSQCEKQSSFSSSIMLQSRVQERRVSLPLASWSGKSPAAQ